MTEDQILEGKQKKLTSPTQTCRPSCSEQPSSKPVSKWASTEGPQSPRVPNGVPNGGPLVIRWNQRPSWHFEESEDLNAPKRPQRNQKSTSEVSLHFCLEVSTPDFAQSWWSHDLEDLEDLQVTRTFCSRSETIIGCLVDRGPTQLIDDLLLDTTIQTSVAGVAATVLPHGFRRKAGIFHGDFYGRLALETMGINNLSK